MKIVGIFQGVNSEYKPEKFRAEIVAAIEKYGTRA